VDLSASDVNRGVVLDGGRLAGFLSITDVMRALQLGGMRRRVRPRVSPQA
jgi:CBS domain-containing protein